MSGRRTIIFIGETTIAIRKWRISTWDTTISIGKKQISIRETTMSIRTTTIGLWETTIDIWVTTIGMWDRSMSIGETRIYLGDNIMGLGDDGTGIWPLLADLLWDASLFITLTPPIRERGRFLLSCRYGQWPIFRRWLKICRAV